MRGSAVPKELGCGLKLPSVSGPAAVQEERLETKSLLMLR
jgi:hypothetical protein